MVRLTFEQALIAARPLGQAANNYVFVDKVMD
jgi:hypothetical protein